MQSTRLGWQLTRSVRGSVLPRSRQLGRCRRLRKQLQQSSSEFLIASVWVHAASAWCIRVTLGELRRCGRLSRVLQPDECAAYLLGGETGVTALAWRDAEAVSCLRGQLHPGNSQGSS